MKEILRVWVVKTGFYWNINFDVACFRSSADPLHRQQILASDGSSLLGWLLIEAGMMCAVSSPSSCLPASPLG